MQNKQLIVLISSIIGALVIGLIVFSSVIFETDGPKIDGGIPTHWNLKDDIDIKFSDSSGIRSYQLQVLLDGEVIDSKKEIVLNKPKSIIVTLPKPSTTLKDGTSIQYKISITDWSNSHFFNGNTENIDINLIVDTMPPKISYIASSFKITRGGSAVIAFEAKDTALKDVHITNGTDRFKVYKYQGENTYISIIAWPLKNFGFNGQIIAEDLAGNKSTHALPITKNANATYYRSNLTLKEDFLNGKLNELISQIDKKMLKNFEDDIERFRFFNETIRQEDENRILQAGDIASDKNFIDGEFRAFEPLKGSQVVGSFGDSRTYFFNKEQVSKSLHLGIDVASVKNAPIISSNNGVVVLKNYLGLYGNTVMLYHGFGVSSLYSHMLESDVNVSDNITRGTRIGRTGTTGWAFGDHLHFSILVQGHFVRLTEWIDSKWVSENLVDVLEKTKLYAKQTHTSNK